MVYPYTPKKRMLGACFFSASLALFLLSTFLFALIANGPVVLATELNPNGTVEYLCLGSGCEDLFKMDW